MQAKKAAPEGNFEPLDLPLRRGAAALLGGIIGLERERRGKLAEIGSTVLAGLDTGSVSGCTSERDRASGLVHALARIDFRYP